VDLYLVVLIEESDQMWSNQCAGFTPLRGWAGSFLTLWHGRGAARLRSTTKRCKRLHFWWRPRLLRVAMYL
jgi:hypothetical protein